MTKIAFLGNSHGDSKRLADKYNDLLEASDLKPCEIFDGFESLDEFINTLSFKKPQLKSKLLFKGSITNLLLECTSENTEIESLLAWCNEYNRPTGDMKDTIVINVFEKATIEFLKEQGFRLVHILHNNSDIERITNLIKTDTTLESPDIVELAASLLTEFKHSDLCVDTITYNFNNKASLMKELHRLFIS